MLKISTLILGTSILLMGFVSAKAFAACTCSSQVCLSTPESALYLACVATSQATGLPVGFSTSTTALFNAITAAQGTDFTTHCGHLIVPVLPALSGLDAFQTGQTIGTAVKSYAKAESLNQRDAWTSFETMSTAQCLTTAKTIP